MIDALVKNDSAYFSGFYFSNPEDFQNNVNGHYFEYEELKGSIFSASQIVQNLLSVSGSKGIRTRWALSFKPRTWVCLDGEMYIIESIEEFKSDYTPQTNYLFKNAMTEYYLQLVRVDDPKGRMRP